MQAAKPFEVVLAHSSPVVRDALAAWMASHAQLHVVGQAGQDDRMVELCSLLRPDALIVDTMLEDKPTFDAARKTKSNRPSLGVCFLSETCHDREIAGALAVDAKWFIALRDPPEAIEAVLRAMRRHERLFSPSAAARLVHVPARVGAGEVAKGQRLSERQREVLRHVATGLSKREVAVKLLISPRTVERHVANIMSILDIHDRVHLARFAIREGLVEA
jgi:DNA-binding NarL/FixJ family response regulator